MDNQKAINIHTIYFSPTGTTKKILEAVIGGINPHNNVYHNLTDPKTRDMFSSFHVMHTDTVDLRIFAGPVYSGKLPSVFKEAIKHTGPSKKQFAFAMVVYGNRDPGIALRELVEILEEENHYVLGAAAFIGEHSFSGMFPIAVNRPDNADLIEAGRLGAQIRDMLIHPADRRVAGIPGKQSMIEKIMPSKGPQPVLQQDLCSGCGLCVKSCPMDVLDHYTFKYRDKTSQRQCLGCMSCVKKCPSGAREFYLPSPVKQFIGYYLKDAVNSRKNPSVFF